MDSRDFLLTTDFPLDKVIYMASGSNTVPASGFPTIEISHNLPFRPLITGSWSLDANFSTSKDPGFPQYGDFNQPYLEVSSTPTLLRVSPYNTTSGSVTFYWRVYGFMPPNVNEVAPFTASQSDDFVMNTDYNYTKLFSAGIANLTSGNVSIDHNLGYRPQVEIWAESAFDAAILMKENFGSVSTDSFVNRISVNNTSLQFIKGSFTGLQTVYYYRIYADEQ